jgi:hypothetical protein
MRPKGGAPLSVALPPALEEKVMNDAAVPCTDPMIDVDRQIFPLVSSSFGLSGRDQLFSRVGFAVNQKIQPTQWASPLPSYGEVRVLLYVRQEVTARVELEDQRHFAASTLDG